MKIGLLSASMILFLLIHTPMLGQEYDRIADNIEKKTYAFAERDSTLYMDLYGLEGDTRVRPCVIFIFGGGFVRGGRDLPVYNSYFNTLVKNGIRVASIDYRLGLRGKYEEVGIFNTAPLKKAIDMAVEDLFKATSFLISRAGDLGIDPKYIIVSGSSAGAITSLQADWYKRSSQQLSEILPEDFQYSGVISFSGAVFSTSGKPQYEVKPGPTMLFHGSEDSTVPYNQRRLLNKGFFGSKSLAKLFSKNAYPYHLISQLGAGHEVAVTAMGNGLTDILLFIDSAILRNRNYQMETSLLPLKD